MKKTGRKIAAAVCAVMGFSFMSSIYAFAISDVNEDHEISEYYESEIFDIDEPYYIYSSSDSSLKYNSMADGTIDKKSGNYARWIDRIEIPECGMDFYNKLYEWSDNDGIDDYLIEDSYFESGEYVTGGGVEYYGAEITSLSFDEKLTSEQSSYYVRMFAAVYAAFDYDNPQYFWLCGKYGVTWHCFYSQNKYVYTFYLKLKSTDGTFDIRGEQYRNENAIKNGIALQNKCIDDIIVGAPLSRYERVKYFNNWLITHNEYNTYVSGGGDSDNVPFSRECITALKGNVGKQGPVCEGYARAMKVLCDKVGIPCILVRGNASGGAHMWNNVMLNGKWYVVDVTWNDPVCGNEGAVSGCESEKWLLVGSDNLSGRQILNRLTSYVLNLTNQPIMETSRYVYTNPLNISTYEDEIEYTQISIEINDYIDHELYIDGKKVLLDRYLNGDGYLFYYCIPSTDISGEIELREEKWTQERISEYTIANINEDIRLYYYNPNAKIITKQINTGDYVKKDTAVCVRVENADMPENGWIEINGKKVDCEVNNDGQYQIWAYDVPDDSNELRVIIRSTASENNDTPINETNFPDSIFRQYVSENFDTDKNGVLSDKEKKSVESIYVQSMGISNLKGIENFVYAETLVCGNNDFMSIDIGGLEWLQLFDCVYTDITELDLSKNIRLEQANIYGNSLRKINFPESTLGRGLSVLCYGNELTCLDLPDFATVYEYYRTSSYPAGDVGTSFSLDELTKYGFDPSRASDWKNAEYDPVTNSLINITGKRVTYTYKCRECADLPFEIFFSSYASSEEPDPTPDPEEPIPSFVERLYENILNRPSDGNKVTHTDNLENGESACKVAYDFVFSSEFANLPISNEERVKRMYLTFLNREADPAGLATWVETLDNGCSIGHIFYGFTQSNEFTEICEQYGITRGTWEYTENRDKSSKLTAFVSRLYTKAMGRAYDVNGLNDHTGSYLENHDLYQLAYNFIFSREFINKNLTDEEFVDVMYRTFFDREADPTGKADWLDRMANQGYTREDVLACFVGSQECMDLVAKFGI